MQDLLRPSFRSKRFQTWQSTHSSGDYGYAEL